MAKPRRSILSEVVKLHPTEVPESQAESSVPATVVRRRSTATKDATIQQTVYLPPLVHDQLRELAFAERVKMHALIIEGLDEVFKKRGMKPIDALTPKA